MSNEEQILNLESEIREASIEIRLHEITIANNKNQIARLRSGVDVGDVITVEGFPLHGKNGTVSGFNDGRILVRPHKKDGTPGERESEIRSYAFRDIKKISKQQTQ